MSLLRKCLAVLLIVILVCGACITVSAAASAKKISITGSKYVAKGKTVRLDATVSPKDASQKVTWKSSNESIATVTSKGVVKGKKAGTVTITATSKTNPKVKKSWKMTVAAKPAKKITIKASVTELDLAGTNKVKLKASVSPKQAAGKVNWISSDPTVAKVSSDGEVTALKVGTATITAQAVDGSKVKKTIRIKVINSAASGPTKVTFKNLGNKMYTFSMNYRGLKKKYPVNAPETGMDYLDFNIGIYVSDGNTKYYVSTEHFKFEENPKEITLYDMQSNIWLCIGDGHKSIGDAELNINGTVISWTVTFPEDFIPENARIISASYMTPYESGDVSYDIPLK